MTGRRLLRFVLVFLGLILAASAFSYLLEPLKDGERRLLAVLNPSRPIPGLDGLMVLLTDFTIAVYALLVIVWAAGCALRLRDRATADGLGRGVSILALAIGPALAGVVGLWRGGYGMIPVGLGVVVSLGLLAIARGLRTASPHHYASGVRLFWLTLIAGLLPEFAEDLVDLLAVYRPRPLAPENLDWNQVLRVVPGEEVSKRSSFPSGHAMSLFAMIAPLYWTARRRTVRAGLLALASVHAYSRLYLAAHFPGCVLAGSALGFAVGTLVTWGLPFGSGLRDAASPSNARAGFQSATMLAHSGPPRVRSAPERRIGK